MFRHRISPAVIALAALALPGRALAVNAKCYTFQRGTGADVADAYIAGHQPAAGHGAFDHLLVGGGDIGETASLLWFDLSGVPSSAEVVSAVVTLHEVGSSAPAKLFVHRVTEPWDEDEASWLSCGGAFDPAVEAVFDSGAAGPVTFDVSDLVQGWIDETLPNDGLIIAQARGARTMLSSSEHAEVARRPRLDICFAFQPDPAPESEESAGEGGLDAGDELGVLGLER